MAIVISVLVSGSHGDFEVWCKVPEGCKLSQLQLPEDMQYKATPTNLLLLLLL